MTVAATAARSNDGLTPARAPELPVRPRRRVGPNIFRGHQLDSVILSYRDAQVDSFVYELRGGYRQVYCTLTLIAPGIATEQTSSCCTSNVPPRCSTARAPTRAFSRSSVDVARMWPAPHPLDGSGLWRE
jgi:hypothetical protein